MDTTHENRSETQGDILRHLQEVVGSDVAEETLVTVLEECEWNIERAVSRVLGLPDPTESNIRHRNVGSEPAAPSVDLLPPNQHLVRATIAEPSYWWWTLLLLFEPLRVTYNILFSVVRFFTSFLWPDPRNHVTDPAGDVRKFIELFKTSYVENKSNPNGASSSSVSTIPPFFEDSYERALREAKRSLRYLVVYLHGDSHEDTREFCQSTLQSSIVLEFLSRSDQLIFWGCNIKSPEGYRVSRTLREHTYPFIGVIGLTNLTPSDDGRYTPDSVGMALLGRIEGAVKPRDLVEQLESILNDHQDAMVAARLERQEREVTVLLRREQDDAYQRSLEQDRAKLVAREEERRLAAETAAKLEESLKRNELLALAHNMRQAYWRDQLPAEPDSGSGLSSVRLSVKMPNGRRFSRVFSSAHSLKVLYYYVLSLEESPQNFEIQANFPKRLLDCQPPDESDLDDYVDQDAGVATGRPPPTESLDWTPKSPNDPPSFQQLGLCKPEVLFVIDKDA